MTPLPPGSTIGIIGGGQLGRMMALSATQLGYRTQVYAPDPDPPAASAAGLYVCAAYDNVDALLGFANQCDVVTYEFENLPAATLDRIADKLAPSTTSLAVAQDRAHEKRFIEEHGGTVSPWREIGETADLDAAGEALGFPLVLKSRRLGYDGKGQAWVRSADELVDAWEAIDREPAVAEAAVDYRCEFSVIVARRADGATTTWDVPRNIHDGGILRRSVVPAGEDVGGMSEDAVAIATALAQALGHVGVMTVEFFATEAGPIINEIAPRVHNSGHWTIEGAQTSQFEQHLRCIAGLPLGDTAMVAPRVSMDNLLGSDVDAWEDLLAEPGAHLHLYGKREARPGRKMGHVTRLG